MAETSTPIEPGDDVYEEVWTEWVHQGRPARFDRMGEWGGAIYTVLDRDEEYPTIYQSYSLGPTVYDDEGYSDRPSQEGFWHINRNYWEMRMWSDREGRLKLRTTVPPNDLDPGDTV
jgi:hypothetical protein